MCVKFACKFIEILTLNYFLLSFIVYFDDNKAICRVLDQHPKTTQKKLSFLVNPTLTGKEFIKQVSTQYTYDNFDLVLEHNNVRYIFKKLLKLVLKYFH